LLEVVISIETPEEWKQEIIKKYHAKIHILDCLPIQESSCKNLVEIEVEPNYTQMVLDDIGKNSGVETSDLEEVDKGRLKGAIKTNICIGCCTLSSTTTFVVGVHLDEEGRVVQRLISTDKEDIRQLITKMEGKGHTVTLMRLTTLEGDELLTSRQEDLLQIAYERGYFDYPKRISLRDLAGMFGVSISTLSEMLRKGQRKIMDEYFSGQA
jgi:predicted DNA binding protein